MQEGDKSYSAPGLVQLKQITKMYHFVLVAYTRRRFSGV